MTPDEVAHMKELCSKIAVEKDQQKFIRLVIELNDFFEKQQQELHTNEKNVLKE